MIFLFLKHILHLLYFHVLFLNEYQFHYILGLNYEDIDLISFYPYVLLHNIYYQFYFVLKKFDQMFLLLILYLFLLMLIYKNFLIDIFDHILFLLHYNFLLLYIEILFEYCCLIFFLEVFRLINFLLLN